MSVIEEQYLTVAEAAVLLKVSRSTLWRWIDQGDLPAYRLGRRRVLIRREDVEKLITPARGEARSERGERHAENEEGGEMTELDELRALLSRPLTQQERERGLAALEAARLLKAEMHERHGGATFSDSVEIIREMREERTRHLDSL
jgi:excisionase family DNA binding protein